MVARLPDGRFRVVILARGGVKVGDHFGSRIGDTLPARVDCAREMQIFGAVDSRNRAKPGILRRLEGAACGLRPCHQPGDALGRFRAGIKLAIGHEMLWVMQALAIVEYAFHPALSISVANPSAPRRSSCWSFTGVKPSRA